MMISSARNPVLLRQQLDAALGHGQLALAREGLRLQLVFVDRAHHQRRAEAFRDGTQALELLFAIFQVDRVDDALSLAVGERQFHRLGVGGVDHDGRFDLADQLLVEGRDVLHLFAVGALQADVDHVRAVAHLAPRDVGGLFPLLRGHQVLEEARADHVGPFAHQQRAVALLGLHQFDARIVGAMLAPGQCARPLALDHLRDGADVRGRGAAASTHEIQPAVIGELLQLRRQRFRRLAEFAFGVGQAGIRIARDAVRRHLVERPYVVGHQVRTGGAVHADAQQVVILDGSVERVDGLAAQHGSGPLDGDARHHGNLDSEIALQLFHCHQARLEAAGVEAGFDQQIVGPALHQTFGLQIVVGAKLGESRGAGDVEIFVGGAERSGDEARLGGGGILVCHLARQLCGGEVELVRAVFQFVVGEGDPRAAEGVGLDDIRTGFQVLAVDILYDVGARDVEDLRAILSPQVVGLNGKGRRMDHGAHGAIEDKYTLFQDIFERLLTLQGFGHSGCAFLSLTG